MDDTGQPSRTATVPGQHLTKSRTMAGLQCLRRLWLLVHEPPRYEEPAPGSPLDIGQEIGRKAHLLFPGGVLVEEEPWQHAQAVVRTAALMADAHVPAITDRLVDPLPIVRGATYFPDFDFSNSIKTVAPALCPGFGYDDLGDIANGMAASAAFLQLACGGLAVSGATGQLRAALLAYCKRDTLAPTLRRADLPAWMQGKQVYDIADSDQWRLLTRRRSARACDAERVYRWQRDSAGRSYRMCPVMRH
jgi:hypothetical protein